tara:strand:+ start:1951 stop:3354 length:1404 start_codon:yes stop_codon:yes gene_type:complete
MIAVAGFWSVLGAFFEKIMALVVYVIVSRSVDVADFGNLVAVFLIVEFLGYLSSFGVKEYIVRQDAVTNKLLSYCYRFVQYVSVFLLILMLFFVSPIMFLFAGKEIGFLSLLISIQPSIACFSGFYMAILQRDFRFKEIAIRSSIISLSSGSVACILAFLGVGIYSLIVYRYVYVISDYFILRRFVGVKTSSIVDYSDIKRLWQFGWKISFSQILNFSGSKMYEVFVVLIYGSSSLAILDVGRKLIVTIYNVFMVPLNAVANSLVARSCDPRGSYFRFVFFVGLIITPVMALLGAFSDEIIGIFFGNNWLESARVSVLFSFGVVVQVSLWFVASLYIRIDKPELLLVNQLVNVGVVFLTCVLSSVFVEDFFDFLLYSVAGLFLSGFLRLAIAVFYAQLDILFSMLLLVGISIIYAIFYYSSIFLYGILYFENMGVIFSLLSVVFSLAIVYVPILYFSYVRLLGGIRV